MMRIKTDQDMNDDDDDDLHTSMTSETSMILKNDLFATRDFKPCLFSIT